MTRAFDEWDVEMKERKLKDDFKVSVTGNRVDGDTIYLRQETPGERGVCLGSIDEFNYENIELQFL